MSAKCMAIPSPFPDCCYWAMAGGMGEKTGCLCLHLLHLKNQRCMSVLNGFFHLQHQFARLLAFLEGRNSKRYLAFLILNKAINIFTKVRTMSDN